MLGRLLFKVRKEGGWMADNQVDLMLTFVKFS
jgi:hypothetical protein